MTRRTTNVMSLQNTLSPRLSHAPYSLTPFRYQQRAGKRYRVQIGWHVLPPCSHLSSLSCLKSSSNIRSPLSTSPRFRNTGHLQFPRPRFPAQPSDEVTGRFLVKFMTEVHGCQYCPAKKCRRENRCQGLFHAPVKSTSMQRYMSCGIPYCLAHVWEDVRHLFYARLTGRG